MIDDATIKRVASESNSIVMSVRGNMAACFRQCDLFKFARAIEQLARQDQREVTIKLVQNFSDTLDHNDYGGRGAIGELIEAIRASGKESNNEC